jgi:hypothetical protein
VNLIRDILDKQLVDRNEQMLGKVDGLVLELREGKPPRVAYIEIGAGTLGRRLPGPARAVWLAVARKFGIRHAEPFRIPWMSAQDIGTDIRLDLEAEHTPALVWEHRLSQRVVAKLLGG